MNHLHIQTVIVSEFEQNARLLTDHDTQTSVIIDPGVDTDQLIPSSTRVTDIVITHAHIDHAGGVATLAPRLNCSVIAHSLAEVVGSFIHDLGVQYGLPEGKYQNLPVPTTIVDHGDTIKIGSINAQVFHVPGHSPDHIVLFFDHVNLTIDGEVGLTAHKGPVLIGGDTLFNGSIGRTDLPGGNHDQLIQHIRDRLWPLPDETIVLTGHGPFTTIGREKKTNPFLTRLL